MKSSENRFLEIGSCLFALPLEGQASGHDGVESTTPPSVLNVSL